MTDDGTYTLFSWICSSDESLLIDALCVYVSHPTMYNAMGVCPTSILGCVLLWYTNTRQIINYMPHSWEREGAAGWRIKRLVSLSFARSSARVDLHILSWYINTHLNSLGWQRPCAAESPGYMLKLLKCHFIIATSIEFCLNIYSVLVMLYKIRSIYWDIFGCPCYILAHKT